MKRLYLMVTLGTLTLSATAFGQYADTEAGTETVASASTDWMTEAEAAMEELDGTWNVTVKPTGFDTCRRGKPKLHFYQWMVAVEEEKVAIEVVGDKSAFSKLHGRYRNERMYLTGASDVLPEGDAVRPSVVHKLRKLGDRKFAGEHHLLGVTEKGTACMTSYIVKLEKI